MHFDNFFDNYGWFVWRFWGGGWGVGGSLKFVFAIYYKVSTLKNTLLQHVKGQKISNYIPFHLSFS